MKKLMMICVAMLYCAMATVVNAQNTVEEAMKELESKAKLADQNPTNGKMQYEKTQITVTNVSFAKQSDTVYTKKYVEMMSK